jgi:hypothetical protein
MPRILMDQAQVGIGSGINNAVLMALALFGALLTGELHGRPPSDQSLVSGYRANTVGSALAGDRQFADCHGIDIK